MAKNSFVVDVMTFKNDDEFIQYEFCDRWNHIHHVNVGKQKYGRLKNDPSPWYCTLCTNEMPFSKMSNNDLNNFLHTTKPTSSSKSSSIKAISKRNNKMLLPNKSIL